MAEPQRYVSWDRWDAEHQRLRDQLEELRVRCRDLETSAASRERALGALGERVSDLEDHDRAAAEAASRRRGWAWQLTLAFVTGLVLPLAVTLIVVLATR